MFDAEHERIKEILERNASTRDYKIIPVNEDSLTHVFRITEALDRQEYVCFQGDHYLNRELLTTSFMGKESQNFRWALPAGFEVKSTRRIHFAMRRSPKNVSFPFLYSQRQ